MPVKLGEFLLSSGEADLDPLDLAEPAFAFGLGDAGDQEQSTARVATAAPQGQARLSPSLPVGPQHPALFSQLGNG
ncbi:hypothetical protein ACIRQP_18165 [Streptomyces sp. NPDC102274]|uniref:hypothetical protein n=1 Tax=Streptomyces sp. NPDC102274 TaxID=3366151 RepID=UPI0037F1299D